MRLICPNCEAQYEVPDDAIPPGGRDVQCSNCQQSWFQTQKPVTPARNALMLEPSDPHPAPEEDAADKQPVASELYDDLEEDIIAENAITEAMPDVTEAAEANAEEILSSTPEQAAQEETAPQQETSLPPQEATPPQQEIAPPAQAAASSDAQNEPLKRKPLDDAVANILREEAALGGAPAATGPIASPPATETPKAAAPVTEDKTRQRIALMTKEEGGNASGSQQSDIAAQTDAHMRTIPTINEINATLRARAQASDMSGLTEAEKYDAVQRSGFRRGFFMILIIFAILILPYIFADQIIENLPQTRDIMTSYVVMVDQIRISLGDLVNSLTSG